MARSIPQPLELRVRLRKGARCPPHLLCVPMRLARALAVEELDLLVVLGRELGGRRAATKAVDLLVESLYLSPSDTKLLLALAQGVPQRILRRGERRDGPFLGVALRRRLRHLSNDTRAGENM